MSYRIEKLEIPEILKKDLKPEIKQLFGAGETNHFFSPDTKTVAIIGSRRIDTEKKSEAEQTGYALAKKGYSIVSGLAIGSDTAGHRGCVDAGGKTLAIPGSGLHKIYPASNRPLVKEIIDAGGGIISESDLDQSVAAWNLIQRNRLIVALSDAVVVAATGEKGGTVYAIANAFQMKKPIYVLNGTPPQKGGKNLLEKPSKDIPKLMPQFKPGVHAERLNDEPLASAFDLTIF